MPLQKSRWDGTDWVVFQGPRTPTPPNLFIPGVTMPSYEPTVDFTGPKNVGLPAGTVLTPYSGSVAGGVTQLNGGTYDELDFGNTILDLRGNVTLNACRGVLTSYTNSDSIGAGVRIIQGSTTNLVTLNDCEFHNRAQRTLNGIMGRNFVVNRSVFTGWTDGINNAPGSIGSAPFVFGGIVNDSWLGDMSWFRYSSTGVVHPSDTQTHNDASQTAAPGMVWNNVFFGIWPSEWVGTGTPGSSFLDGGNPYNAAYTNVAQATLESWRATYLNQYTRADQSFQGVSRRTSTGGSWAGIMGTLTGGGALGFEVDHCWFSGGTVSINYSNASLTGDAGYIKRSTFWNDMSAGRSLTSTAKGTAVYVKSGLTLDMPTTGPDVNRWFDGTVVSPTTA